MAPLQTLEGDKLLGENEIGRFVASRFKSTSRVDVWEMDPIVNREGI
jgi:hypothetical protein